jgi:predicted dehydrogenase
MAKTKIGIIGCGNISDSYMLGAQRSELIELKACADLNLPAAQAKAKEYGVHAMTVEALLADPDISLVVNLTVPKAHASVSMSILHSGKHAYSEKPLSATFSEAQVMMEFAAAQGLRVGCAPDTFMGASHQACRRLIDSGRIGTPIGGGVVVMSHGMEAWHPNPEFFFKPGGGPILDIGPYYITQLVNLLGPVKRVTGLTTVGNPVRAITSEPLNGTKIQVEVPTTVHGAMEFVNGANVSLSASWDVWKHNRASPIEIFGTEGSLLGVDPNFFGNIPRVSQAGGDWEDVDISKHPFGQANRQMRNGSMQADYRMIGLVDMAMAIAQKRPHRASGELALHVLEVLEAFENSSRMGRVIDIATRCAQPEPVPLGSGEAVFA